MTKNEIINEWARQRKIETLLESLDTKGENPQDLEELCQDLYIVLLEEDENKIERLYEKNQIDYYLLRLLKNNLYSKTSRYYYRYKKNNMDDLKDVDDKENKKAY